MKPVLQTEFGPGNGNCLSACIASILEIPVSDVPNFAREGLDADGTRWIQRLGNWLAARGWGFIHMLWDSPSIPFNCYVIAMGRVSYSDERHAVVASPRMGLIEDGEGGRIRQFFSLDDVFDPHPGGTFLSETEELLILVPGAQ
jgi:hypothetical protein